MRFRVTPRALIAAILVLALVSSAALFLTAQSLTRQFADAVIRRFDLGGRVDVLYSSMDRQFFRLVAFNGFEVRVDGVPVLSAGRLEVGSSVQKLISHIFRGTDVFDIRLESPELRINQAQLEVLSSLFSGKSSPTSAGEQEPFQYVHDDPYALDFADGNLYQLYRDSEIKQARQALAAKRGKSQEVESLDSFLGRTGFRLWLTDATIELALDAVQMSSSGTDSAVAFGPGMEFLSANLNSRTISVAFSGQTVGARELRLALDGAMKLSLSFDALSTDYGTGYKGYLEASLENIVNKYVHALDAEPALGGRIWLESAVFAVGDISGSLGSFNLQITSLNPESLSLTVAGTLGGAEVAVDRLEAGLGDAAFAVEKTKDAQAQVRLSVAALNGSWDQLYGAAAGNLQLEVTTAIDSLNARGSFRAERIDGEGLSSAGLQAASLDEVYVGFSLTDEAIRGDVYALFKGQTQSGLAGDFGGELVADVDFAGAEDFSINARLNGIDVETLPQQLEIEASLGRHEGSALICDASVLMGDTLRVVGSADLDSITGSATMRLNDLAPARFGALLDLLPQGVTDAVRDDTELDLFCAVDLQTLKPLDMTGNLMLAVRNADIASRPYSFSVTFDGAVEADRIDVGKLIISSADYRLDYDGTVETSLLRRSGQTLSNLPSGTLSLKRPMDASQIASAQLMPTQDDTYNVVLRIDRYPQFVLDAEISSPGARSFSVDGTLSYGRTYPITLGIDLNSSTVWGLSDGIALDGSYTGGKASVGLTAEDFNIVFPNGKDWLVSFILAGQYDTSDGDIGLDIADLQFSGGPFSDLGFSLHLDDNSLQIDDIAVLPEGDSLITGSLSVSYDDYRSLMKFDFSSLVVALSLQSEAGESLRASYTGNTLMFNLEDFSFGRFGMNATAGVHLLGRVGGSVFGDLTFSSGKLNIAADIVMDERSLSLANMVSSLEDFSLKQTEVFFDRQTGTAGINLDASLMQHLSDADKAISAALSLKVGLGELAGLIDGAIEILRNNPADILGYKADFKSALSTLSGSLSLKKLEAGDFRFAPQEVTLGLSDGVLSATSDLIDISYSFADRQAGIRIDPDFGIGIKAEGRLDFDDLDIEVSDLSLPLLILNEVVSMASVPIRGGVVHGGFTATGPLSAVQLYGSLYPDKVSLSVFWIPDIVFTLSNPYVAVVGTQAVSPSARLEVYNEKTHERVYGEFTAQARLDDLSYDVCITLPEGVTMPLWVPVTDISLDAFAQVGGQVHIGSDSYPYLRGSITLEDMVVDMSLADRVVPQWYYENNSPSDMTFDVVFKQNNTIYYPTQDNPIMSISIADGASISADYRVRDGEVVIGGDLSIKGGEVYYFQKDFLITEGNINFPGGSLVDADGNLTMEISLKAKMRDYDSSGRKVDIYLNLQNSTLSSINPYFTSVPSLGESEILQLLGESIISTETFNNRISLSSLASLTVSAAEAVGKLGILQTGEANLGLTSVIKNALSLDIFSIRTNLLQNIVIDALPGSIFGSDLTPISKYLNGTSIFAGKYMWNDIFLQTTLSLNAASAGSRDGGTFLSNDLWLDVEISVEWDTPLGSLTVFAQPRELSVFEIFDTMGFSVTRSIQF